jgi:hypothetical protein
MTCSQLLWLASALHVDIQNEYFTGKWPITCPAGDPQPDTLPCKDAERRLPHAANRMALPLLQAE